nr:ester cyclase [Kibdelosporangium sp. MJ126-NF4]CEL13360.1 hypothetical protein [Kibdelosporangium sp. MJ126-NF4]CTQ99050.1 hypothetical protein [Kibdelosporangium sp. MJ126-NF4]
MTAYTEQELANIALIRALRAAPVDGRSRFLHPNLRHHRRGFAFLGSLVDGGYTAESIADRTDDIDDILAKDDRVWAVWTIKGHHTGPLYGIQATGRPLEITEVGIWRIENGLIIEAWFFGDELTLLRQLGLKITHTTLTSLSGD